MQKLLAELSGIRTEFSEAAGGEISPPPGRSFPRNELVCADFSRSRKLSSAPRRTAFPSHLGDRIPDTAVQKRRRSPFRLGRYDPEERRDAFGSVEPARALRELGLDVE